MPYPKDLSRDELRDLQRDLNRFTERFLDGIKPLTVDGKLGPATRECIRDVKYFLGYSGRKFYRSTIINGKFRWRLDNPRRPGSSPERVELSIARCKRQREGTPPAGDDHLYAGSRAVTNEIIRIVNGRVGITSRKRWETFGNPSSDHYMGNTTADAVDFATANNHSLKNEVSRRLGGPSVLNDYASFHITRNGRRYRVQGIAGTHGTGPHLHYGVRLA